jgi:OPT family oligopeptide transporter
VSAGLTSFVLDGRSILRTFSGFTRFSSRSRTSEQDALEQVECPSWWFPAGLVLLGPVIVVLAWKLFAIPLWAGFLALPIAVIMGFVAARATGETDITPTKALGPVTQAIYGVLTPGNVAGNIMSANVTAGIGLHAADLLTDLKSGYMLGANPRQQFIAQMFGVVAGALVVVPAFWLIIPDPALLGTTDWPAPSCLVWAGVSEAFAKGLDTLSSGARIAIVAGIVLGIALALAEKYSPRKAKAWVPSPLGLGISMVIPASNSVSIFIGGLAAELLFRRKPKVAEYVNIPAASGFIAGESLIGVLIAILIMVGVLNR